MRYLIVALAVANPIFIIWTTIAVFRDATCRPKWLWIIFVLSGIGQCTLDWSSGSLSFEFAHVLLLGGGFFRPAQAQSLQVFVAFPMGAVAFWVRRASG